MALRLKLTHKLTSAFVALLLCSLTLGGMGLYYLHILSKSMQARSDFDEITSLGQESLAAAQDWLVHREELSMIKSKDDQAKDKNQAQGPLETYQALSAELGQAIDTLRKKDGVDEKALTAYQQAFTGFSENFDLFREQFSQGAAMVKGLRETSVSMLAKAQSLDKAVGRTERKLNQKLRALRDRINSRGLGGATGRDALALLSTINQMESLAKQRQVAALLLNRPLGFQEMAKDYILYKEDSSGRGLILEMGKILGMDKKDFMGETLPDLAQVFPKGREAKLYGQFIGLAQKYLEEFKTYYELSGKMEKSMAAMDRAQSELRKTASDIHLAVTAGYMAVQEKAGLHMAVLAGVALVVSLVFMFMTIGFIVRPMRRITGEISSATKEIENGAVSGLHRISHKGSDELAGLAGSFNELMEVIEANNLEIAKATDIAENEAKTARDALDELKISQAKAEMARKQGTLEAVGSLESIVTRLVEASTGLSDDVSQSGDQATTLQQRTDQAAVSLEQMGMSIQEVAKSGSLAANNAEGAMKTAHTGAEVVEKAVGAIFAVRAQTDALKSSLHELDKQATDINDIMLVINDIADQTNLLALNAAIEAARAGDAGRGFAVVADEVRKLAEKTMQATKDVDQAIKSIQSSAAKNIQGMGRAEAAVEDSTSMAEEAGEALKSIVDLIEESASQVRNIASAVEQQSAASDEITQATGEVNSIAGTMVDDLARSNRSTTGLLELANELNALIADLKDECGSEKDCDPVAQAA